MRKVKSNIPLDQDYSKPLPLENKEFSESENLYLDIFNASSQFMYFFYVDSSLILREINNRYIELLKVPRTEIIGNHISEIFPSKLYTSVIEKHIIDALAGKTANRELWIHGEERSIYMSINATGRKDNEGNTVGAVIMGFDMTEQKLAEESLVKSDEFHKEIQSLAKLGGWEVFIESGKINLSDEMFQIFKFNRDDFDGKFSTLINYIHEDDRERLSESRNKALQSGKPYIFDYRIITTQGDTRHLKGHARVIKDENNNPVKFIGASLDVTSEKLTELALIENQKLLKEAQNIANLGFWDFDFMTQRLKWSDEAYEIFQLPPEEYLATTKDYVKRIHSDDMERATKDFENTLRNGEPLDHEYRIVRPDGSIRHIYVRAELKLNARNESEKLFGTILDITDLKQTEYALKRTEALLRRYFDADLIGMAITSSDRRWLQVNESLCKMLGYTEKELLSMSWDEITHPDDIEYSINHTNEVVSAPNHTSSFEKRYVKKDGSSIYCMVSTASRVDDENKLESYVTFIQDITERKKIESELERHRNKLEELIDERTNELKDTQAQLVEKEKLAVLGRLTATVSHELRNPLGTINASLYAIKKRVENINNLQLEKTITRAERNIKRCDNIIEELLDYTRNSKLSKTEENISNLIHELVEENPCPEDVSLKLDFEDVILVHAVRDRLYRCIQNVYLNAIQALSEGSGIEKQIYIHTKSSKTRFEISISDTGPGIPDEDINKIFDPLFSTKIYGVGLGLPIVKQIAEQHDGGVELISNNKGTTFTIWLPRSED